MRDSNHLKDIYETKKGSINLQVAFSDIIAYSKRKSTTQKTVIDNFTNLNQNTMVDISKNYIPYAQENDIIIDRDIIKIPTGDGLAVIFPFEGIQSIHLDFARTLLEKVHEHNINNDCKKFKDQGWCNCHDNFNLRIGLSEGKGIIYKDLNDSYNVAGNVINMASRVMSLGDNNSVILTEEAYKNIIDMTPGSKLEDDFKLYKGIEIKHGLKINIYQYTPKYDYINNKSPKALIEKNKQFVNPRTPVQDVIDNLQSTDVEFAICCLLQQIVKAEFLEIDDTRKIYDDKKNILIVINRGGAIVGGMLAKNLGLPPKTLVLLYDLPPARGAGEQAFELAKRCLENIDFNVVTRILLVDDAMRTGVTMEHAERILRNILNEKKVSDKVSYKKVCILYQKQYSPLTEPDFYVYKTQKSGIMLPWDKMHLFGDDKMILREYKRKEFEELCRSMKH